MKPQHGATELGKFQGMFFPATMRKKLDALTTWGMFAAVLGFLALTGAGWAAKDTARPATGKSAPEFTLAGLDRTDSVTLSALRGKVVFIDFWASWCLPCRRLMPLVAALKAQYPDLEVVAISVDANREKAITFLRAVEPSLRAVHDADHSVADRYGVVQMPTSFLVDREGKLRFRHDGYSEKSFAAIERQVRILLDE
jgi:cytochrome c biogenesis protein CcmG/thiol:disulfide interchange protein DsbE